MSSNKQAKTAVGQLPKSVKVRSTCNACQQAKIRCSHEKPSCRRCQKHKIDCIYSVSRRLGRPAKKKDSRMGPEERSAHSAAAVVDRSTCERKNRRSAKPKATEAGATSSASLRKARTPDEQDIDDSLQPPMLETGVDDPFGMLFRTIVCRFAVS